MDKRLNVLSPFKTQLFLELNAQPVYYCAANAYKLHRKERYQIEVHVHSKNASVFLSPTPCIHT